MSCLLPKTVILSNHEHHYHAVIQNIWFGLHFKKTCHHKTTFESWEKMENLRWSVPLIPNKNSLNSTHTPPPPLLDLVWRNTEKIWWQKKKIENWGGGGEGFLEKPEWGVDEITGKGGHSSPSVVSTLVSIIPSCGDSYSTPQPSFLYSFPHIFHFI